MGIFGSKQHDEPAYQQDQQDYAAAPVAPQSTDGFIPSADPSGMSTPPIDEHMHDDPAGDYIMADPPAQGALMDPAQQPAASDMQPTQYDIPVPETHPTPVRIEESPAEPVAVHTPTSEHQSTDQPAGDTLDELVNIKRQALQQLSPLVSHLDQSPEERFRTTLMLLQSTDDRTLIKPAYEAAQAITDKKARAQALLEIINEIDYLTNK